MTPLVLLQQQQLQQQAEYFYFSWTAYFAFVEDPSYSLVLHWRSRSTRRSITKFAFRQCPGHYIHSERKSWHNSSNTSSPSLRTLNWIRTTTFYPNIYSEHLLWYHNWVHTWSIHYVSWTNLNKFEPGTDDRDYLSSLIVLQSYVRILLFIHRLVCKGHLEFQMFSLTIQSVR